MPRLVARAFLLLLVAATILPTRVLAKEERLIGWLGEVARPLHGSGAPGGDKPTGEAAELAQLGYWLEPCRGTRAPSTCTTSCRPKRLTASSRSRGHGAFILILVALQAI